MSDDGFTPTPGEIKRLCDDIRRGWPRADRGQRRMGAPVVAMLVAMVRQAHTDLKAAGGDTAALQRSVAELRSQVLTTLSKARRARRAIAEAAEAARWVQNPTQSDLSVSEVAEGLGLNSEDVIDGLKGEMASDLFGFILGLPGSTCPLCQQRMLIGVARNQPEDKSPTTAE